LTAIKSQRDQGAVGGLSIEDDARSLAQRKLVNSKNPSLNGDSMNQAEDLKPSRDWDKAPVRK
jgi:hypothetical protein